MNSGINDRRNSERRFVETELDINIDTNNMEATSVNISETGICFDTDSPLEIDIKFTTEDGVGSKTGRLVWARKNPEGKYTYAFEFI